MQLCNYPVATCYLRPELQMWVTKDVVANIDLVSSKWSEESYSEYMKIFLTK